ncbi:hypothetical protein BSKO_10234 [Bryopsis sp. KO-2023]|nr:hypothetical protein BSKO_10234 [Bryopsis sp. KO-2023]
MDMVPTVEIVLVAPSTIPVEVESRVEVRFILRGVDRIWIRVLARTGRDVISTTDVAATNTSTGILNITSGSVGLIEIGAITERGILHCTPAMLLAAPQAIADEANQLSNLVVDDESDREQVEEAAWRKYFHPLIQDVGVILRDAGCHSFQTEAKLHKVLEYLILNQAYKTAQFLLRVVAGRGVPILWHGNQIPAKAIDLQGIYKSWSGQ